MARAPTIASAQSPAGPALLPTGIFADKPHLPLNRLATIVGARQGCHLNLLSADISQFHALIVCGPDGAYLRDLASRSHSYVNGAPVHDHDIHDGDRVQFGRFSFAFAAGPTATTPPRTVPPATLRMGAGGKDFPIRGRVVLIGRRITADIVLTHESISNAHAIIFAVNGARYIRDLGSRTGTHINGNLIHQQELKFGDTIRIGNTAINYVPAQASPMPADVAATGEPHLHAARPPTPSSRTPPFGHAARAAFKSAAPIAPPPPVVSAVEPPAVSHAEPPAVSHVEPPVVSEVETLPHDIPVYDEPLSIPRQRLPIPAPALPAPEPEPLPIDELEPLPIAVEPPVVSAVEPPEVSQVEPPAPVESAEPIPADLPEEIPLDIEPAIPLESASPLKHASRSLKPNSLRKTRPKRPWKPFSNPDPLSRAMSNPNLSRLAKSNHLR
jgi:pSer/pThr/pTyr-binding forkhead associated (FHA) protein